MYKIIFVAMAASSLFSYSHEKIVPFKQVYFPTHSIFNKYDSVSPRFSVFLKKFKPLPIRDLNSLGTLFNNEYFLSENLMLVSNQDKSLFLSKCAGYMYYHGFRTVLPNGRTLLTFRTHHRSKNGKGGSSSDTTFFECFIFNNLGNNEFSFRTFGTNLGGEPPTYNLTSKFLITSDRLIVNHFEYSIGKSYESSKPINGSDSVYNANLKESISQYNLSNFTGNYTVRKPRNIQVVESISYPSIVILKPIPPLFE